VPEIEWHPEADAEFRSSGRFYESRQEGLGVRFGLAVLTAVEEAALDPERYQGTVGGCQLVRVKGFPYSVIYQGARPSLRILAIMHQHRRPGYWKDRAESWMR